MRYEANPPKLQDGRAGALEASVGRIERISKYCSAVHITEDVLGRRRVPPLELAAKISDRLPRMPLTVSMRVRDRSAEQIRGFAHECASAGVSGVLAVMGDPRPGGGSDSGQRPSGAVDILRAAGARAYLSVPAEPGEKTLAAKAAARPDGFVTQVVSSASQVRSLASRLPGFEIIPIVMFSSPKNAPSARMLGISMPGLDGFAALLKEVTVAAGDALVTSPSDFAGLLGFLARS